MITAGAGYRELDARLRAYVGRRVAAAADVDDVVQEVFVRIQGGIAELRDEERLGPWVYRVAANTIADLHRRRSRRQKREVVADVQADVADDEPPPSEGAPDLVDCVALFVAQLPSPYREAITLTELQGMTQSDAAELLGISPSGMKSRVQRGRAKLRAMFEACCEVSLDCRNKVIGCDPRSKVGCN